MELVRIEQLPSGKIRGEIWDLILAVSGYEARANYLVSKWSPQGKRKVVLAYKEKRDHLHRRENDRFYAEAGYEAVSVSEFSSSGITALLQNLFTTTQSIRKILVDYSCMQKEWYATILQFFMSLEGRQSGLEVWFSYTPSEFLSPVRNKMRLFHRRKPRFSIPPGDKPGALILGLDFEESLIRDIYKRAGDYETWLCYADPAFDPRFVARLEEMYADLISLFPENRILRYPLQDLRKTSRLLTSLALDLRLQHKVILAPFGPKPFILTSLMLGARYPDITVWYPKENSRQMYDWMPLRDPQICRVTFVRD